ncbi:acyl-CoA thioesterase [Alcaligenaceae bacterium]|nr:acyl-CoA thioesterase [Alcaligenaceae bacterium]
MTTERRPPLRAEYRAFQELTTRWADNDSYGHMNNVVHYALFDTAVNHWLIRHVGLDIHSSPVIGLVVESGCRYFGEMGYPDLVTAGLRVARLGNSSVVYEVGLFRNGDESASASGFFTHVYVDRESKRPQPLASEWRNALEALLQPPESAL